MREAGEAALRQPGGFLFAVTTRGWSIADAHTGRWTWPDNTKSRVRAGWITEGEVGGQSLSGRVRVTVRVSARVSGGFSVGVSLGVRKVGCQCIGESRVYCSSRSQSLSLN